MGLILPDAVESYCEGIKDALCAKITAQFTLIEEFLMQSAAARLDGVEYYSESLVGVLCAKITD